MSYGQSYGPVYQQEPVYHQNQIYQPNLAAYSSQNDFELHSAAPSFTSSKNVYQGQGGPVPNDATSDYHRLLREPGEDAKYTLWSPGFWIQFPWLGILSILGILASTVASLVILVRSHRQPLEGWGFGIAPSVYLSIASVVANGLTAYALANGLEITFWRYALQGRTLAELNQNWLCGQNMYHAFLQGYRAGGRLTALACIMSVVALLRGPLYQRASSVVSDIAYESSGNLRLSIATNLPEGYTGLSRDSRASIQEIARLTPDFAQIMQAYSLRSNVSIEHSNCGTACFTGIKAFGFKTQCRHEQHYQDFPSSGAASEIPLFSSTSTLYPIGQLDKSGKFYEDMGMRLNATYKIPLIDDDKSVGKGLMRTRWESHICDLTGAVVSYNVVLSSQGITRGVGDESVVKDLVMPGPGTWGHNSNIGGFEYAASYLFTSNATFHFAGAISSATLTGSLANEVVSGDDAWNLTFSDPMNGMLDTMREIAFRTAVRAGKDYANVTNSTQEVQYTGRSTHSIYNTDFRYMAGAVVVSILSVIAIGITFYGWWELGRTVSLSPLEIAKAFDAPLLAHIGSNLDLSHNKHLGPIATARVRYGAKINEQDYSTQYTGGTAHQRRRLVMGVAGEVRTPTAGEPFGN